MLQSILDPSEEYAESRGTNRMPIGYNLPDLVVELIGAAGREGTAVHPHHHGEATGCSSLRDVIYAFRQLRCALADESMKRCVIQLLRNKYIES